MIISVGNCVSFLHEEITQICKKSKLVFIYPDLLWNSLCLVHFEISNVSVKWVLLLWCFCGSTTTRLPLKVFDLMLEKHCQFECVAGPNVCHYPVWISIGLLTWSLNSRQFKRKTLEHIPTPYLLCTPFKHTQELKIW